MTLSELITQLRELEAEGFGDTPVALLLDRQHVFNAVYWTADYFLSSIDAVYFDGRHVVVEG